MTKSDPNGEHPESLSDAQDDSSNPCAGLTGPAKGNCIRDNLSNDNNGGGGDSSSCPVGYHDNGHGCGANFMPAFDDSSPQDNCPGGSESCSGEKNSENLNDEKDPKFKSLKFNLWPDEVLADAINYETMRAISYSLIASGNEDAGMLLSRWLNPTDPHNNDGTPYYMNRGQMEALYHAATDIQAKVGAMAAAGPGQWSTGWLT